MPADKVEGGALAAPEHGAALDCRRFPLPLLGGGEAGDLGGSEHVAGHIERGGRDAGADVRTISEDGRLGKSHATGDRTLTCPRTLPAVLTLAAVVLTATAALAQELVTAERESLAAITRAGEAIGRAGDTEALLRAAERAFTAAPRARAAFAAADRARDAAAAGHREAYGEALAGAVTCENGYPCTNGRIGQHSEYTGGPRIVTRRDPLGDAAQVLQELHDGTYARKWIDKDKAGRPWFIAQRRQEQGSRGRAPAFSARSDTSLFSSYIAEDSR